MARQIKSAYSEKELEDGGMRAKVAHMVPRRGESNVQLLHIPFSDKLVKFYPIEVALAVGERIRSSMARKLQDAVRSYFAERDA